jgi:cbb3-type cytochrome oxidase subunit 3
MGWIYWFSSYEHTKPLALVILFVTFVVILVYVYGNKKRGETIESHKNIPFLDDDSNAREEKK